MKRQKTFRTIEEIEAEFMPATVKKRREEREAEEARAAGGTGVLPAVFRALGWPWKGQR